MTEQHPTHPTEPDRPGKQEPVLMSTYRFRDGSRLRIETFGDPAGDQDDASRVALALDALLRLMTEET